ncbi:MAG: phosphotransferase family protein [Actinobacteria bacterium]|nr:phosphotransferase family protein [Actinomycetota bacterium]
MARPGAHADDGAVATETVDQANERLTSWLRETLGDPGPFVVERMKGGNSNDTLSLTSSQGRRILRRPPVAALSPTAHSVSREFRLLQALAQSEVDVPEPLGLCEDAAVAGAPFMVMEAVEGISITETLPDSYPTESALHEVGVAVVDALAKVQAVPWQELGLTDFGRPEGFLGRQVARWTKQLESYQVRELPLHAELARWLAENQPADQPPAIMHGDFHIDNCLLSPSPPIAVRAIIDWEMATIGDPLIDLAVLLAFWGNERPKAPAMAYIQGATRAPGSPSRQTLAERYAERSGRSIEHLDWYMTLAFWKLAAIVEAAYAQYVDGTLRSDYARSLERDVPRLLEEAAGFAGIA